MDILYFCFKKLHYFFMLFMSLIIFAFIYFIYLFYDFK